MKKIFFTKTLFIIPFLVFVLSCNNTEDNSKKKQEAKQNNTLTKSDNVTNLKTPNLLTDFPPIFKDGDINVVVEIPAGTTEKWEVEKENGTLQINHIDGKPRIINYLGYPGNYGMIPQTLLPKELGGDGDPLDVIVLGSPVKRGSVVKCKLIGVLYLLDRGEQDDKLIAVMENTPLYHVNTLSELNENYIGITQIIQLWFSNYKGSGKMQAKGFGEKDKAKDILMTSIEAYKNKHNKK